MIVITTPTGQIGQHLLEELRDSDESVRVVVRDPSRLPPEVRERVEVVQGSHDDEDVLADAFAGADCVFWVVPPNPRTQSADGHYLDFTQAACAAMVGQGVTRVVAVSSLGRQYGRNAGLLSSAFAMDDLIEQTVPDYRALRMPFFMDNLLNQVQAITDQGAFFMPHRADRALATVATRDIAPVAATLLLDRSWNGHDGIPVIGPDDLTPTDMAQTMSDVLDRPVRFQQVSGEDYKATLLQYGITEAWAQGVVDMAAAQNDGVYDSEQRVARPTPTTFRQWCETTLKPAVLVPTSSR